MKIRFFIFLCFGFFLLSGCGSDVYEDIGASCRDDRDCSGPSRCLEGSDFPDGFCSLDCSHSGHCPSDTACIDKKGGVCLFQCDRNADCPAGWECSDEKLRENSGVKARVCIGR